MMDPTTMSPGSLMPPYPWLLTDTYDASEIMPKITVMRKLGVPYPEGHEDQVAAEVDAQAQAIVDRLADAGVETDKDREIIALIAYLQRLGTDIKLKANR
jgi:cytochrome c oxidase cbb3-type subunit I/II